jgi:tetratricopeptide (TPR) repeat protein
MNRNSIILILIFIIALFSDFSSGANFKEYIAKGDESFKELKNMDALNYYEDAYKIEPGNFVVMLRLVRSYNDVGEEYYEQKKRDEAEAYMNKAVDFAINFKNKFPDSADTYSYLSLSYGNIALFKGGKERIKYANLVEQNAKISISLNGNNFLPYLILGIYYRELASLNWIERIFANTFLGSLPKGTYEDSEKYLKKALSIDPDMVVAVFHLSKTYKAMGRSTEEISLLKQVQSMQVRNFRDIYAKQKAKKRLSQI